jgi:hypothetical protein
MTNSNNKKSVKRNNFKDVQLCYILEGIEGVSNLAPLPGKKTLIQAINGLTSRGLECDDLLDFTAASYPGGNGRGRASIAIGESRTYKVQNVKGSGSFIRLPLSTLNVKKGDVVTVTFEDGTVNVTPSS